jgi:hypothetical protein
MFDGTIIFKAILIPQTPNPSNVSPPELLRFSASLLSHQFFDSKVRQVKSIHFYFI